MLGDAGGFLDRQRALLARGDALFAQERVRITARVRDLRIPGQWANRSTAWLRGAVVVTSSGLECSIGDDYTLAAVPWAPVPIDAAGFAVLDVDGLLVHLDVDRIVAGGRGTVELRYALERSVDEVAAQLPTPTAPLPFEPGAFAAMAWRFLG